MIKQLPRNESGYSLVEVMASIMILAIAIIPMVGMFDVGLRAATTSGNYDKARALANEKLEQAKSRSYTNVRDTFPSVAPTATPGLSASVNNGADPDVPAGFSYTVRKQFLKMNTSGGTTNLTSSGATNADGIVEVTVKVSWGTGSSYSTSGVISRGTLL